MALIKLELSLVASQTTLYSFFYLFCNSCRIKNRPLLNFFQFLTQAFVHVALKFVFHVIIKMYARRDFTTKLINNNFENAF